MLGCLIWHGKGRSIRTMGLTLAGRRKRRAGYAAFACMFLLRIAPAAAQLNTRLLLLSGAEVPGHGGLAFGPFSSLMMNGNQEVAFLTTLRSPRIELRAVVRSTGVSFSVAAFQGLLGPFPRTTYDTFSAPSLNDAGVLAFTATLITDQANVPKVAVVRQDGAKLRAVATNLDSPPGQAGATFEEFSAPVVLSDGNVLFAARWSGASEGSGLFVGSAGGLQAVPLPKGFPLNPKELLEPFFFGHDEAAFLRRGIPPTLATEQFFRALAIQTFQDLQPPPDPSHTAELVPGRADGSPVQMLLVYLENAALQAAVLVGDPSKPVMAQSPSGPAAIHTLGGIKSITIGQRGNVIFSAAPVDTPNDLALYCYCDGRANRLTTAEDFLPITAAAPGKSLLFLTGDTQQTTAFVASTPNGDNTAIYVTTIH